MHFRINERFKDDFTFHQKDIVFLKKICNNNTNFEIKIKCFKLRDNNGNIIVTEFSSLHSTELNFTYKEIGTNFTSEKVINECWIFEIEKISGLI